MKKYNATLTITSVINSDESDKMEFVTEGSFYFKNGSYYILYDETEEMGMADCCVTVKVGEEEVSVSRKGDFSSKMIYKKDMASEFLYHTPYGRFPLILTTQEINNNLSVIGGRLELLYCINIESEQNYHTLSIDVKTN